MSPNAHFLASRITKAKSSRAKAKHDLQRQAYEKLKPVLSSLCEHEIDLHASVEEIFPMEDRADDRSYSFRLVKTQADVETLIASLKPTQDNSEHWNVETWLNGSYEDGEQIIEVRRDGETEPAGFAAVMISFHRKLVDNQGEAPNMELTTNLEAIYVRPSERGKGHSEALSWAIGAHIDRILRGLADLKTTEREGLSGIDLEILVSGEAHSAGGARFLARTLENIESNLEYHPPKNHWVNSIGVLDNIDFSDYPDCGFSDNSDDELVAPKH